jgi:hypothetical protein
MASNRTREINDALVTLATKAGACVAFEKGGVHRRAVFTLNGRSRFNVLTGTPSNGAVIKSVVAQAKRTLRQLGAAI